MLHSVADPGFMIVLCVCVCSVCVCVLILPLDQPLVFLGSKVRYDQLLPWLSAGELFAMCPVDAHPGVAVEPVADSSRYFILRLLDPSGMCNLSYTEASKPHGSAAA